MKSMYIGSGDTSALLAGVGTKSHGKLLKRFVSNEIPHYNAKSSPIDALRTGAILEDRYALTLEDDYFPQHREVCSDLDVLRASIDFAKINKGEIVDFDELKTCNLTDYLEIEEAHRNANLEFVKKKYKNNYNQVNFQLLCSGLKSANLVFLVVYTYEDEVNENRIIKNGEFVKFRIERDEKLIDDIKSRAKIFQEIKNIYFKK